MLDNVIKMPDQSEPPAPELGNGIEFRPHTIEDLRSFHVNEMRGEGKSEQQIRNRLSALNKLLEFTGDGATTHAADLFNLENEENIAEHVNAISNTQTQADRASHLRAWEKAAVRLQFTDGLPERFTECLEEAMRIKGYTITQLAHESGIPRPTISKWIHNHAFPRKIKQVYALEDGLTLPRGTLVNRRPTMNGSRKKHWAESLAKTEYGKRQQAKTLEDNGRLSTSDFPDALKEEWWDLFKFKTAPFLPKELTRTSSWTISKTDEPPAGTTMKFVCSQLKRGHTCNTAIKTLTWLQDFYTYIGKETNIPAENFSLVQFVDAEFLLGYINWRAELSGGYSKIASDIINGSANLTREHTGYLIQHPEYGLKLSTPIADKAQWEEWCLENRRHLLKALNELTKGGHITKTRDPEEPIRAILNREKPLTALLEMVDNMRREFRLIPERQTMRRAILARDIALIQMLIEDPLRAKHFVLVDYLPDNSGHLRINDQGRFCCHWDKKEFKNGNHDHTKDRDIVYSAELTRDLHEYITNHWPLLKSKSKSGRIFLPQPESSNGYNNRGSWTATKISRTVLRLTRLHCPDTHGFGPHAFRHIIPTHVLKQDPRAVQIVAHLLHDKLKTVMENYAHLIAADGMRHYAGILDDVRKDMRNASE